MNVISAYMYMNLNGFVSGYVPVRLCIYANYVYDDDFFLAGGGRLIGMVLEIETGCCGKLDGLEIVRE